MPGGAGEFNLIVVQHTDCGITRLVDATSDLESYFQVKGPGLAKKAVADPYAAVAVDVAALRAVPGLPPTWLLSGIVYDVKTTRAEVVVPPAPIAARANSN